MDPLTQLWEIGEDTFCGFRVLEHLRLVAALSRQSSCSHFFLSKNEKNKLKLFLEYTMTSCRCEVPACTWNGRARRKMTFAAWVVFAT